MSLLIEIDKKHIYILGLFLAIFIGALVVSAYNSGLPPNIMGHSPEELGISGCGAGDRLTSDGSTFSCATNNDADASTSNEWQNLQQVVGAGGCTDCITGTHVQESSLTGTASSLSVGACNADSICEVDLVQTSSQYALYLANDIILFMSNSVVGQDCFAACALLAGAGKSACLAGIRESDGQDVGCGFADGASGIDCLCVKDV